MRAFGFVICFLAAVYAQNCPPIEPAKCGPEDMVCPGGLGWEGCPMPDMCMPGKG